MFTSRTGTGTGAATAALRPLSRGLAVRISPSYRGQVSAARALDEAVGSVHSRSPTITGSTEDVSEERTRSSDLDSVQARGTPPRARSSLAAC